MLIFRLPLRQEKSMLVFLFLLLSLANKTFCDQWSNRYIELEKNDSNIHLRLCTTSDDKWLCGQFHWENKAVNITWNNCNNSGKEQK